MPFLRKMRRGVRNTLPCRADRRGALLLPLLAEHEIFRREGDKIQDLLCFGTIIGFMAMLRPHTFNQLSPASFTIVTWSGRCFPMPRGKIAFKTKLRELRKQYRFLGFFIDLKAKQYSMREHTCQVFAHQAETQIWSRYVQCARS